MQIHMKVLDIHLIQHIMDDEKVSGPAQKLEMVHVVLLIQSECFARVGNNDVMPTPAIVDSYVTPCYPSIYHIVHTPGCHDGPGIPQGMITV